MSKHIEVVPRRRNERGMTTAEYAVGTVATVSIVGIVIKLISDPKFRELLWNLIQYIVKFITGLSGG